MIALRNTALATGALGAYMFGTRRWGNDGSGLLSKVNQSLSGFLKSARSASGFGASKSE